MQTLLVRSLSAEELIQLNATLAAYERLFRSIPDTPYTQAVSLIDGSEEAIEAAGWLFYEGVDSHVPTELLDAAVPLLVLKALLLAHGGDLVMTKSENGTWDYGVSLCHRAEPITCSALRSGAFVTGWPNPREGDETGALFALKSIEPHVGLLSLKRNE